ncbi:MAG: hypothetical protein ACI9UK_002038 [Candidatus Krumholzibacteriia bacterium]
MALKIAFHAPENKISNRIFWDPHSPLTEWFLGNVNATLRDFFTTLIFSGEWSISVAFIVLDRLAYRSPFRGGLNKDTMEANI